MTVQTSYVGDLVEMCGRLDSGQRRLWDAYGRWRYGVASARYHWMQRDEIGQCVHDMRSMCRVLARMHARTTANPPAPWEVQP
jgi:hypothetical protein